MKETQIKATEREQSNLDESNLLSARAQLVHRITLASGDHKIIE